MKIRKIKNQDKQDEGKEEKNKHLKKDEDYKNELRKRDQGKEHQTSTRTRTRARTRTRTRLHCAVGGPVRDIEDEEGEGEEATGELVDVESDVLPSAAVDHILGHAGTVGPHATPAATPGA